MSSPSRKPFVLVFMPFDKSFDDVYELGIKPAAQAAGAVCERIDEQIFLGSILTRIYNQIAAADIIIADMTGQNPNVYYETGYAHALGKAVILIIRDSAGIPFDLKHFQHVVYEDRITELKKQLREKIGWFIKHPGQMGPDDNSNVPNLVGRWLSKWKVEEGGKLVEKTEVFTIERQRGRHVFGKVVSQEPELGYCECKLEGTYNGRYLQVQWSPTGTDQGLIDYGSYFLEHQPDGNYKGFAVGHFWNLGRVGTYEQVLTRIKD